MFNRYRFPAWYEDKSSILLLTKPEITKITKVEIARLYIRYSQIKEAYLLIEFLELLMQYKQISRKTLFQDCRLLYTSETIDSDQAKKILSKKYKPTRTDLKQLA